MKNYTLYYLSEADDCTGEWSGHYSDVKTAVQDLLSKILALSPDAEIVMLTETA